MTSLEIVEHLNSLNDSFKALAARQLPGACELSQSRALWEIALQLSIANEREAARDTATAQRIAEYRTLHDEGAGADESPEPKTLEDVAEIMRRHGIDA